MIKKAFWLVFVLVFLLLVLGVVARVTHLDRLSTLSSVLSYHARKSYHWRCSKPIVTELTPSHSVRWLSLHCRGRFPTWSGLGRAQETRELKLNLVDIDLSDPHIALVPSVAKRLSGEPLNQKNVDKSALYRETLLSMGQRNPHFIAGINGGYFYENRRHHQDENCIKKTYPQTTARGIGDGLLEIHHKVISENCSSGYFSEAGRTSIEQLSNGQWRIRPEIASQRLRSIQNALGAGPGLIDDYYGRPLIRIRWEGILSTFEFSANSALVTLQDQKGHQHVVFFTVDGADKLAGMNSMEMANFIETTLPGLLKLHLISAMSLDQGRSSGLYIRDNAPQIVSTSSVRGEERPIFDALFVKAV
jgi:hypothetical protein